MSEIMKTENERAVTSCFVSTEGMDILREALAADCRRMDFSFSTSITGHGLSSDRGIACIKPASYPDPRTDTGRRGGGRCGPPP